MVCNCTWFCRRNDIGIPFPSIHSSASLFSYPSTFMSAIAVTARAITFKRVIRSISCLVNVYKTDWQFTRTHDLCMIKQMASLKFYIIVIVTSFVLGLFHYPKYFRSPVWQDFTVVDNQGKKEVSYGDSTRTIFLSKQK